VCDGSGTNRSLWKEFGISGNRSQLVNRICHPAAELVDGRHGPDYLYFFSDYVHLFKCMRNNLLNKKEFMVNQLLRFYDSQIAAVTLWCNCAFTWFWFLILHRQLFESTVIWLTLSWLLDIYCYPISSFSLWLLLVLLHFLLVTSTVAIYARKQLLLSVHVSHRNSVRPSVCLSVTRVDQAKTVQDRITKFSPSAATEKDRKAFS